MVVIDNIVHLSVKDLITHGFSQSFVDKQTSTGAYPCTYAYDFHQPSRKEVKLIPYTGIPEATRTEKKLPTHEDLLKQCKQDELLRLTGLDEAAYNYYLASEHIKNSRTCTREHAAKSKAEQVHLFRQIASIKNTEARKLGYENKERLYEAMLPMLKNLADERKWPAFKCTTVAGLRKRLKPFQKLLKGKLTATQAYATLINNRVNNKNASKLEEEQENLLIQLYSDANAKPNTVQVFNMYTAKAKEMIQAGFWTNNALVEESTVRQFLYKPAIKAMWFEARHGLQEYRNVYEPVTLRSRASFANAMYVIDGTPSHRYFQHGDHGRYFRFNLFPILDAHSWCVIGFWLSEKENTDAVLGALRSACMVSGYMPYQILYDNSSAIQSYRAQEAIHKISVTAFAAQAGNARAKIVENFFHLFNQDVQKFRPGFTHNPFAISLNNRPNREALARMVKSHELPAAEAAIKQAIEDLTIWNNMPRKFLGNQSPLAVYRKSIEATRERQRPFTEAIDIAAFWQLPGEHKKVRTMLEGKPHLVNTFIPNTYEFTNRGIEITIQGRPCSYDIEQAEFRDQFIGQRFSVRYEPNPERWSGPQPDKLLLYLQGEPLCWQGVHVAALPKQQFAMAVADYRPGEGAQLRAHLDEKRKQREITRGRFAEVIEATKRNGTYTEVITANAFDKEVLQNTEAELLNQIIQGDNYRLNQSDEQLTTDNQQPTGDRLSNYDKPLPLD